jgi:hypothetical protein
MSYNASIPQATDSPSQSQSQILTNFTQLNTIFGENHIKFDAGSGNGEHTLVTFNDVLAAHAAPASPKTLLYTKTSSGKQELFFENDTVISQLTGLTAVLGANGTYTFPGGLTIKWGNASVTSVATTVTFPIAFTNNCWTVIATANNNGGAPIDPISVTITDKIKFRCFGATPVGEPFYYIAIGN